MHDENGNPLMIAGSLVDITEQKANEEKLKDILYYDILTGLKNRNCFEKDMKKYLEDPSATGSILCIDIHNFKIFNEIFGRDFANKILIEFTRIISLYISDNLGVYRLEGDEFLVHIREKHPGTDIGKTDSFSDVSEPGTNPGRTCDLYQSQHRSGHISPEWDYQ